MSILSTRGLVKAFRKRRVVDGVSFRVEPGEIVGLLGPNGAGKTTSFLMVLGMVRPDEGEVLFRDEDVTRKPIFRRARLGIAYLPQEPSVFRKMTVEGNILAILETLRLSRKERAARLEVLLDELGLRPRRTSRADTLSGGERRRLEITRALVLEPTLLLLDEPFAGVDPIAVQDIQGILRRLRDERGMSILLTDHNVRETLSVTDRSYIIAEGILRHGAPPRNCVADVSCAAPTSARASRCRSCTGRRDGGNGTRGPARAGGRREAAVIEVANLSHAYGAKRVLDGVTFVVAPGEVVGFLGPNGAGKSTTLKLLLGILAPTGGTVRVAGLDPAVEGVAVKALTGYVPESGALYETFTPREYLTMVGRLRGLTDAQVRDRGTEALGAFDLGDSSTQMTGFSRA
jgi:lipopolysaccharide export system ATP-binding protein